MTRKKCGCVIDHVSPGKLDIRYCAQHKAAQELLRALRGAVLSVEWRATVMYGPRGINPDPEARRALSDFADMCRSVIAKAEGQNPPRGDTPVRRETQERSDS